MQEAISSKWGGLYQECYKPPLISLRISAFTLEVSFMQTYTIREISRLFSLPLSTLRYYEEEGLLTNVQKSASGQRIYTQEHIDRLHCINCFKRTGMTLAHYRAIRQSLQTGMPMPVWEECEEDGADCAPYGQQICPGSCQQDFPGHS